ncbi:SpoIIAA-like [Loktanella fryxellensis]|uniref:SpoIIAA-like n=1 Tax=Loktanella fryxellensis TaxID=245187 RepID=A0A1H7YR67_9RHOB|nr:STAS/SEC14 domain-containing protein [Loktanella fryxellensis]SEM47689.1 SpoIIAA-like [Loktanella fryxellensis]
MTSQHGITPIPTDFPHVYAFEITDKLDAEGMRQMGDILNAAFDRHPGKINILLRFKDFEASDAAVGTNLSAMKAQFGSLTNVNRYATVGAPPAAETMIEVMNHVIPVDAKTFSSEEERDAWAFVNVGQDQAT